jgi:hypothetical protein
MCSLGYIVNAERESTGAAFLLQISDENRPSSRPEANAQLVEIFFDRPVSILAF